MTSFIRLTDFSKDELLEIFKIADSIDTLDGSFLREYKYCLYRLYGV